jgi:SOS-response transcriptional repressor LexA
MFQASTGFSQMHIPVGKFTDRSRLLARRLPKTDTREAIRNAQRQWLQTAVRARGESASQIAKAAGVSDTTVTRFLNNPNYQGVLNPLTVQRISEYTGIAGPGADEGQAPMRSFREEAVPYVAEGDAPARTGAVAALLAGRPHAYAMVMQSTALELAGVRPGDIMIIDPLVAPADGDVVCAQLEEGMGATTVYRIFQMPNLVGASFDPRAVRPESINGTTRRIVGVMTDLVRRRG